MLSERARVKPARVPARKDSSTLQVRKDSSTRKNRYSAALAAERLVDATKEAEESAKVAAVDVSSAAATAAAALSAPEEAQVSLSGSTAAADC